MSYEKTLRSSWKLLQGKIHLIQTIATISVTLTIAIILLSTSMIASPVVAAATTTTTAAGNDTTASSSTPLSSGIILSLKPIYQERSPSAAITPINQTHGVLTFTGNGTLTLPNSTQTINTTSNGKAIISFATSSGYAKETIKTENGETATATIFEIVQFNNATTIAALDGGGGGKGIVTAVFQTNSTGVLAPLNGMILVGIDNMSPSGESHVTLWRWESGISNASAR